MEYIGIDTHKAFSQICVTDEKGRIEYEGRIDSSKEAYQTFFLKYKGNKAVMESTGFWEYLYDAVEGCGLEVTLSNPLKTKLIASAKLKTDKIDARMLAHLLRSGLIAESHVPEEKTRRTRSLLVYRDSLVRASTRQKNIIHSELLKKGMRFDTRFSKRDVKELRTFGMFSVNESLDVLEILGKKIEECNDKIDTEADMNEDAKLLDSIPGIGKQSALIIASWIDGIDRFPSAKKLASYCGLNTTVRESADKYHYGRISKQGASILRWTLIECTHSHKRLCRNSVITKFYMHLLKKKGKSRATVAAANKLVSVIYSILVHKREFYVHGRDIVPEESTCASP